MADKIRLRVSESQRNLLLEYERLFFDEEICELATHAVKKGKGYEICADAEVFDALLDEIAACANHETDAKRQRKLDGLYDDLEALYMEAIEGSDSD
ncbi:MAG TPA: hypothetical protein P5244_09060 [Syntrophales bacterium]|jgi:hypothetical protein|nr:hypothetical protein [Syntrophales bacterium]HRT88418.1 hypothetical protein [Anaerohalosphaeraceae bacterium]